MLSQRGQPAPPAGAAPDDGKQAALLAIDTLEKCLRQVERENTLRDLVAIDLRCLASLRTRFAEKPRDPDNHKLLRQISVVWSTRLSGVDYRTFREIFRLVEKCEKPQG